MKGDATRGAGEETAGRTLALDFGDRRIGIAVSDPRGIAATPLLTLERTTWDRDLQRIRSLVLEHEVRRIVVGLPLDMDGTRGGRVRITEIFMQRVAAATGLPVGPGDERRSTVPAERPHRAADGSRARRRRVIDQVAAVILLQTYLDAQRAGEGER